MSHHFKIVYLKLDFLSMSTELQIVYFKIEFLSVDILRARNLCVVKLINLLCNIIIFPEHINLNLYVITVQCFLILS